MAKPFTDAPFCPHGRPHADSMKTLLSVEGTLRIAAHGDVNAPQ